MPEKISKTSSGKYRVTGPHGVHAKGTTKAKAEAQVRLLNAIDHGYDPDAHKVVHHSPYMPQEDHNRTHHAEYPDGTPCDVKNVGFKK